jgi:lipopolysaccharide biosynthesis protein
VHDLYFNTATYFDTSSIHGSLGWKEKTARVKQSISDKQSGLGAVFSPTFAGEIESFLDSMVTSANVCNSNDKQVPRFGWGTHNDHFHRTSTSSKHSVEGRTNPNGGERIAVVLHLHYPDLWNEILLYLSRIEENFSIFVTITDTALATHPKITNQIKSDFPDAFVFIVENKGRDIGALFFLLEKFTFADYAVILKLHSKKSLHRLDGEDWRTSIFDALLPKNQNLYELVSIFDSDPKCGVMLGRNEIKGSEFWGSNLLAADEICGRIGLEFDANRLVFPAGSMYWIRPFVLERLLDLGLSYDDFAEEAGAVDGQLEHVLERILGILLTAGGFAIAPIDQLALRSSLLNSKKLPAAKRVFAFYLPQFHRIPENDEWWGEGFTEWTNVNRTRALFPNHTQPLLPSELGQYDLSNIDVLSAQWRLANEYGLSGFIFHHYWFSGKKLLETPIERLRADKSLRVPFALCWANESWTRTWDGLDNEVLIKQSYLPGWEAEFVKDVYPFILDERYILIENRPLLVIYRVGHFPEPEISLQRIRKLLVAETGMDPYIVAVIPNQSFEPIPESSHIFIDAFLTFPPNSGINASRVNAFMTGEPAIFSYRDSIQTSPLSTFENLPLINTVFPGWDNTARRGVNGTVFHGGSPITFRRSLNLLPDSADMVFVNAWNEWAEGAVLEPSNRYRRGNLEAIQDYIGKLDT